MRLIPGLCSVLVIAALATGCGGDTDAPARPGPTDSPSTTDAPEATPAAGELPSPDDVEAWCAVVTPEVLGELTGFAVSAVEPLGDECQAELPDSEITLWWSSEETDLTLADYAASYEERGLEVTDLELEGGTPAVLSLLPGDAGGAVGAVVDGRLLEVSIHEVIPGEITRTQISPLASAVAAAYV